MSKSPRMLARQSMYAWLNALAQGAENVPMYGLPVQGPSAVLGVTDETGRPYDCVLAEDTGEALRKRAHAQTCASEAARFLTAAALAGVNVR